MRRPPRSTLVPYRTLFRSDLGAVDQQRRRRIARRGREAALAAGRHVAHLAPALEAVGVGFPPPFGLVEIGRAHV